MYKEIEDIPGDKYIFYVTHALGEHLRFFSYVPSIRKYLSGDSKLIFIIWKKYADIIRLFRDIPDLIFVYDVPYTTQQAEQLFESSGVQKNKIIYVGKFLRDHEIATQIQRDHKLFRFRDFLGIPHGAPVQKIVADPNYRYPAVENTEKAVLLFTHSLSLRPPEKSFVVKLIDYLQHNGWNVMYDKFGQYDYPIGSPISGTVSQQLNFARHFQANGGVVVAMLSGISLGLYLSKIPHVVLFPGEPPYSTAAFTESTGDFFHGSTFDDITFEPELGKFEHSQIPVRFMDSASFSAQSIKEIGEKMEFLRWAQNFH